MQEFPVSATYLKSFLQCPLQFYFRYHTDKATIGLGQARAFGTAVHAALEYMYTVMSSEKRAPEKGDYEKVVDVFMKSAIDGGLDDQSLYEEGYAIISRYLDTYNADIPVIGLEIKFGLPRNDPKIKVFTDGGTPLAGAIDKVIEVDKKTIAIIDYKTSRVALTEKEALRDEQLSLYDLAASKLFPQYEHRILVLDYIRHSPIMTTRTKKQREDFGKFVDSVSAVIGKMSEEQIKRPRPNSFCGWCDYRQYCPAYAKILNDPDLKTKPVPSLDKNELVEEWARINTIKRSIKAYAMELNMQAEGIARSLNDSNIVGEEGKLVLTQRSLKHYNTAAVVKKINKKDLAQVVSVNKKALESYLADKQDLRRTLLDSVTTSYASSYFRYKSNKK